MHGVFFFFSFGACLLCLLGCVQLYKMGCGKLKSEKGEKNASGRVFFSGGDKGVTFLALSAYLFLDRRIGLREREKKS